jgi:hypothetical protein
MFRVVPIAEEHKEEFRAGLDSVARERRYLTFLEASSLQETRRFIRRNIRDGFAARNLAKSPRQRPYADRTQRGATQVIRMDGKYENLICMGLLLD